MLQVPLSERSGVDLNDGVLGQSLSTDELLVGSVVHGIQDTSLVGSVLTGPDEVSSVESHGTELEVSTTASDSVNSLVTNLGVSSGSTELELSLLLMDVSASTSSSRKGRCIKEMVLCDQHTYACDGCREKFPFK